MHISENRYYKMYIVFVIIFSIFTVGNFLFAAWGNPAGDPSVSTNSLGPIDTSSVSQTKAGGLSVGSLDVSGNVYVRGTWWFSFLNPPNGAVDLQVPGRVGASRFCDTSGNNCVTAADLQTLITSF